MIKKLFYWLVIALLCLSIIGSLSDWGRSLFSFRLLTVDSGSMAPAVSQKDVILIRSQGDYQPDDVITFFQSSGELVTHRLVKISDNSAYITKGDANQAVDSETVMPGQVLGRVVLVVPYFGWLIGFLKTKLGLLFFIILPALAIIVMELGRIAGQLKLLKTKKNKSGSFLKLLVLSACVVNFWPLGLTRAKLSDQVSVEGSQFTAAVWTEPELSLGFSADRRSVFFRVSVIRDFDELEYELIYDSSSGPQGITGQVVLSGQDEYEKEGLVLGTCSASGSCVYHQRVDQIELQVVLTNTAETKTLRETISY